VGCTLLNCAARETDPHYWNHAYNSEYIGQYRDAYDLGLAYIGTGLTHEGLVVKNITENPKTTIALGLAIMGAGVIVGGSPAASAKLMGLGAATGGSANVAAQLILDENVSGLSDVNWTSAGISSFAGALSVGQSFVPVLLINVGGAEVSAVLNGQNPNDAMLNTALGVGVGYSVGTWIGGVANNLSPAYRYGLHSYYRSNWYDIGLTIQRYVPPSTWGTWLGISTGNFTQEGVSINAVNWIDDLLNDWSLKK
jgi:hypothetical protein